MHHEYNMPIIEIEAILTVHGYQRNHVDRYDSRFDKKNINRLRRFIFHRIPMRINFVINVIYFFHRKFGNSRNWESLRVYLRMKRVSKQYLLTKNIFKSNFLNFTF